MSQAGSIQDLASMSLSAPRVCLSVDSSAMELDVRLHDLDLLSSLSLSLCTLVSLLSLALYKEEGWKE